MTAPASHPDAVPSGTEPIPIEWVRAYRDAAQAIYDGPHDPAVDYETAEVRAGLAAVLTMARSGYTAPTAEAVVVT